jgi:DNA-binding MarR family transcriptional regulator
LLVDIPAAPVHLPADAPVAGDAETAGLEFTEQVEALQEATRVLTGVALRSLDVLDGVITLPQFRMLAVLAELGRARSARVARALGLDASTVTRLADRLVAAGHVARGSDPRHRSVVTLGLTPSGQRLVGAVSQWRRRELSRIVAALPPATRSQLTTMVSQLGAAAGEGYGLTGGPAIPL